jgi:hypothetical protein
MNTCRERILFAASAAEQVRCKHTFGLAVCRSPYVAEAYMYVESRFCVTSSVVLPPFLQELEARKG